MAYDVHRAEIHPDKLKYIFFDKQRIVYRVIFL